MEKGKSNRTPPPWVSDEERAQWGLPVVWPELTYEADPAETRYRPYARSRQVAEPSWPRVLATTLTLWLQRRAERRRALRARRASRGQWIRLAVLAAVVLLAAAAGVALAGNEPGQPAPHRAGSPVPTTQNVRAEAAAWIVAQVSRDTIVSCDPVMCSALQSSGFPPGNLLVLRPGSPGPADSKLIIATSVLRSEFGARLATAYAPVVLASFGSGSAAVQVRAVAPDGAPAYLRQLSADLAARKSFGGQMVHNPRITVGSTARRQLESGRVDSRLIAVIGTIAQANALRVVSFGDAAPAASPGVPLRKAILMPANSHSPGTMVLDSVRSFLEAQQPPYLPAAARIVRLPAGQQALSVQYALPGPLGLLTAGQTPINTSS